MPMNFVSLNRCINVSTAARSGRKSNQVELTKTRMLIGFIPAMFFQ